MSQQTSGSARPARSLALQSAVSLVDQAWLSLLNMAVGLLLIRLTTQAEYGVYAQVFAAGLLAVTVAESLVVNPLVTLGAGGAKHRRGALIANMAVFHRRVSAVVALGVGCLGALWLDFGNASMGFFALGLAAYCFATARREYQRSMSFLEGRPTAVLGTDVAYGLALMAVVGILAWQDWLEMPVLMAAMALACVVPWVLGPKVPRTKVSESSYSEDRSQALARGKIGLPGALTSWTVNFSYLYVAAAFLGAAAAAELNASRLLLVPVSLAVVAWGRVARPMLGGLLTLEHRGTLKKLLGLSSLALIVIALGYTGVVMVFIDWLEVNILGDEYTGLSTLVIAWAIYFAAYSLRWVGTVLLLALDAYKDSLAAALVSLGLLVVILPICLATAGVEGAVYALIGVEVLTLLLIWLRFVPRRLAAVKEPA